MNPYEIGFIALCAAMIAALFALFHVRENRHARYCRRAFRGSLRGEI